MANSMSAQAPVMRALSLQALARNWWLIVLRGACAIAFGIVVFIWPGATLAALVLLYGALALADGVLALAAAITGNTDAPRRWLVAVGFLGIAAGVVTLFWPGMTAVVLQFFIAAWAIAAGVMQVVGALQIRKEIDNEWLLIAAGALLVLLGLLLVLQPGVGALALLYTIGTFALLYGVLLVIFALRLRDHSQGLRR